MGKDIQSRKWLLTINHPEDKGYIPEVIKEKITGLKSIAYFCMAKEEGLETKTPHVHVHIAANHPIRQSTIKRLFPEAHI